MSEIKIIDHPGIKSLFRKTTEWTITTLLWSVWIYLIIPIGNLLVWFLGTYYFYWEFVERTGFSELKAFIYKSFWFILIIFVLIYGWGIYNYLVFGRNDRRNKVKPVTPDMLAPIFCLSLAQVKKLQNDQELFWTRSDDPRCARAELSVIK